MCVPSIRFDLSGGFQALQKFSAQRLRHPQIAFDQVQRIPTEQNVASRIVNSVQYSVSDVSRDFIERELVNLSRFAEGCERRRLIAQQTESLILRALALGFFPLHFSDYFD
jgi:hypothetical protein